MSAYSPSRDFPGAHLTYPEGDIRRLPPQVVKGRNMFRGFYLQRFRPEYFELTSEEIMVQDSYTPCSPTRRCDCPFVLSIRCRTCGSNLSSQPPLFNDRTQRQCWICDINLCKTSGGYGCECSRYYDGSNGCLGVTCGRPACAEYLMRRTEWHFLELERRVNPADMELINLCVAAGPLLNQQRTCVKCHGVLPPPTPEHKCRADYYSEDIVMDKAIIHTRKWVKFEYFMDRLNGGGTFRRREASPPQVHCHRDFSRSRCCSQLGMPKVAHNDRKHCFELRPVKEWEAVMTKFSTAANILRDIPRPMIQQWRGGVGEILNDEDSEMIEEPEEGGLVIAE